MILYNILWRIYQKLLKDMKLRISEIKIEFNSFSSLLSYSFASQNSMNSEN